MNPTDLQRDPLLSCMKAQDSKDGRYCITFESERRARSWAARYYRLMALRRKDAGLAGDYDTVDALLDYSVTRQGPLVTVRYLPKDSGIVTAE